MIHLGLKHFNDFYFSRKIKIFKKIFTIGTKLQNNNFRRSIELKFCLWNSFYI